MLVLTAAIPASGLLFEADHHLHSVKITAERMVLLFWKSSGCLSDTAWTIICGSEPSLGTNGRIAEATNLVFWMRLYQMAERDCLMHAVASTRTSIPGNHTHSEGRLPATLSPISVVQEARLLTLVLLSNHLDRYMTAPHSAPTKITISTLFEYFFLSLVISNESSNQNNSIWLQVQNSTHGVQARRSYSRTRIVFHSATCGSLWTLRLDPTIFPFSDLISGTRFHYLHRIIGVLIQTDNFDLSFIPIVWLFCCFFFFFFLTLLTSCNFLSLVLAKISFVALYIIGIALEFPYKHLEPSNH